MTAFDNCKSATFETAPAGASAPARVSLSPEIATRLLDLLSSDDAFRDRFTADPREALLEIGHETPSAHLGVFGLDPVMSFSYFEGGLASKEALKAAREKLLAPAQPAIFSQFDICAG